MNSLDWKIEPLTAKHTKDFFSSGKEALDTFLKQYALQNQKKNIGRTYVAVRPEQHEVKGYYTISSSSVAFLNLPDHLKKGLPKYPLPVVLMGRLAVHLDTQGMGIGALLLIDASKRARRISLEVGICGMEVFALDEKAKQFYSKFGFMELTDDGLHLFLPMKGIANFDSVTS